MCWDVPPLPNYKPRRIHVISASTHHETDQSHPPSNSCRNVLCAAHGRHAGAKIMAIVKKRSSRLVQR
eukprot:1970960-Alexandrium_andersonii.AAC.1